MKVKSQYTEKTWVDASSAPLPDSERPSPGLLEVRRALAEVMRCNNLVILSGLGTSLCVLDEDDAKLAPTMGDLWESVRTNYIADRSILDGGEQDWDSVLKLVHYAGAGEQDLERLLSQCRLAEQFLTDGDLVLVHDFIAQSEKLIARAVDFIGEGQPLPTHEQFIQRIARRGARKSRAKVFTTNYDLCFEHAAQAGRFVVIDGFSPTLPPHYDPVYYSYDIVRREANSEHSDFIQNVFHLYKMHGSINWTRSESTNQIRKESKPEKPLLIYPRYNKYELVFTQPYLEMMAAFQAALREPNTGVLVIGFGFRDSHIAEPVLSAIRSNLSLKCVVVAPYMAPYNDEDDLNGVSSGTAVENPHLKSIDSLIHHGDARLALIDGLFEEVVQELPDLTSETDLEQHMDRLRRIAPQQ